MLVSMLLLRMCICGYSPESNNGGSGGDYDYGAYPQARTFSLGVNLTF